MIPLLPYYGGLVMNHFKSGAFIAFIVLVVFVLANSELKAEVVSHAQSPAATSVDADPVKRFGKNPMRYNYVSQQGDYIKDLDPPYKDMVTGKSWYQHFLTFPVTYYIGPCLPNERDLILQALKQYQTYFPMEEVTSPSRAALAIEVVEKDKLIQLCGQQKKMTILGCGGPKYSTTKLGANTGRAYRGYLYVKKNMFYVPGAVITVVHELGHAFGITGHSKNPKDVMYFQLDTWALASNNMKAKDIPKHLTYRDVNTLYMIYNSWFDK